MNIMVTVCRDVHMKQADNLLCELSVPLAKLPVLSGESLGSRLQLADVELQLSGVVPGDLQLAA